MCSIEDESNIKMLVKNAIDKAQTSDQDLLTTLKNSLVNVAPPEVSKQLMAAMDRMEDYIVNEDFKEQDTTSFIELLVRVLTPYFTVNFLQHLKPTLKIKLKILKLPESKSVPVETNRVVSKVQEAMTCSSAFESLKDFENFLVALLKWFFIDLDEEVIRNEVKGLVGDVKVQVKQGVDKYVSKQLIPELSTFIESKCGVAPEKQLLSLKPFIMKGLETFLNEGRMLNKVEIITLARKSIPELITETAVPNANEKNKETVAKIVAIASNAAFKNGLTPTSYSDFVKSLRDSLYDIVLTESKEQLIASMNELIDYMYSSSFEEQNTSPISKLLVGVLEPYLPNDFLQCLESTVEDTWKTLKLSTKKVLQKTVVKTIDRLTNKVLEAKSWSSVSYDNFENFLSDLLKNVFSDLKVEIQNNELKGLVGDVKVQVQQGVDEYVTKHLIPELSTFIESKCGVAPEKQLLSLKPFIMKGLETFLHEGRILNKDEIITLARKSIPELITETAVPNASENTKKRVQKVVTTATNTAFDNGMTTDVITNTLPVAATEILIPEESEITKKRVQNILKSIQEIVFNSGSPPSAEKLFHTLLEKCGNEVFCLAKDKLMETINDLIETFPDDADKIMEFLMKHVLPALSVCFEDIAFGLLTVFLKECFERFRKKGMVKGRNLAKPLLVRTGRCAIKAATKCMENKGIEQGSTVVTTKISHKVVEKCVIEKAGEKMVLESTKKVAAKNVVNKVTQSASSNAASTASQLTAKQSVKTSAMTVKSVSGEATVTVVEKATQRVGNSVSKGVAEVSKIKSTIKRTVETTLTDTAEGVTTTTTKKVTQKVTQKSVSKTTTQTTSKAAAEVGMKNAAKAGVTAAGISAIVEGVFLYNDLKELDKKKNEGTLTLTEYGEQKAERIGEFAGDVIGSGVVGTAVSIAALTGPAGWAAIGVGAFVSFATGKLGGYIAKQLA